MGELIAGAFLGIVAGVIIGYEVARREPHAESRHQLEDLDDIVSGYTAEEGFYDDASE